MSERERKPYFRFNPNAYLPGRSMERSDDQCDLCRTPCEWRYTGAIYGEAEPVVCAACIAEGKLTQSMHDIDIEGADPSVETELLEQTPGVACFNPFDWPVIDGVPLAFLHYGQDEAASVWSEPAVGKAIAAAYAELGWDEETEPGPYTLLFREVDGERYRVVIDLD